MAKSMRSKRARKFRAVKREKNEVIERKRLYAVTAKLGTLPPDVIVEDDTPKHFVHTAPIDRTKPTLDLGETAFRKRKAMEAKAASAAPAAMEVEEEQPAAAAAAAPSRFSARQAAQTLPSSDEEEEEDDDSDAEAARIFHHQTGQFKKVKHSKVTARKAEDGGKRKRTKKSLKHRIFV